MGRIRQRLLPMARHTYSPRIAAPRWCAAVAVALTVLLTGSPALVQAQSAASGGTSTVVIRSFKIEGDNPFDAARTAALLRPFTGEAPSLDRLQEAAATLEKALRAEGFGFFRVTLPPQETTSDIVLKVVRFPVGKLIVSNNKHFDEANIRASVPPLSEGQTPNTQTLARALAVANENPAKRITAAFKEGAKPDTIDVNLEVTDNRPYYAFAQLNNSGGGGNTGNWRLTGGISHANLWNLDHQGTITYTTAPDHWSSVKQYGFNYKAPIYALGGVVTAYYSYSTVFSGVVADAFNVTGGGRFSGITYTQYFAPRGDYRDYLSIGLDDKYFINDTRFIQSNAAVGGNARTRPLTIGYTGRLEKQWGSAGFNVEFSRNISGGRDNNSAAYVASPRAGADAHWSAWRASTDVSFALPQQWTLGLKARGQVAREPLLSGEQFGIGGSSSVRGVNDRVLSGESGISTGIELSTAQYFETTRFVGFVEGGTVWREHRGSPVAGTLGRESLASAGFGVRFNYRGMLTANLDYGRVISGAVSQPRGTDKLHASFVFKY